ncbi:thioredoxin [candidate division BRC1 bacterium HGW-BRC1-1]|jgi:thioredoxin 1|nr:MAG: thioredoxin [candidate division BRC1 bacterium HGW-BRC1-1]
MSENALEITDDKFDEEVLKSETPVLVDFWATWCGPCKAVGPIVDELATEYAGKLKVGKVDVDTNQRVAASYGIQSIPTLLIFKNGEIVERITGAYPKNILKQHIDKHI